MDKAVLDGVDVRLYGDLAEWWLVLSPPEMLEEEAHDVLALLQWGSERPIRSLMELGSGTGALATHIHPAIEVVLVDHSEAMLDVSRRLNPDREHIQADMRTLSLSRQVDAVLLHDAVMYLTSEEDLGHAVRVAAQHLAPGGALLIAPDTLADTFHEGTVSMEATAPNGRSAHLTEWHWDPDPEDGTTRVEFSLLLREPGQSVVSVHESHELGLHTRERIASAIARSGLSQVPIPEGKGNFLNLPFLAVKPLD